MAPLSDSAPHTHRHSCFSKTGELPTNIPIPTRVPENLTKGTIPCTSVTSHPTTHSNWVPRRKLGTLEFPTAPVTTEKFSLRWGMGTNPRYVVTKRPHSTRTMDCDPCGVRQNKRQRDINTLGRPVCSSDLSVSFQQKVSFIKEGIFICFVHC